MSKLVFISHITAEKELALLFKDMLETAFVGAVDVFVSSSDDSISPGAPWLQTIFDNLDACSLELSLCSVSSVKHPWITFEAGAAWGKHIKVVPICHSSMTISHLPAPLNSFQAVELHSEHDVRRILGTVAEEVSLRIPSFDASGFIETVHGLEAKYTIGSDLYKFFDLAGSGGNGALRALDRLRQCDPTWTKVNFGLGTISQRDFDYIRTFYTENVKKYVQLFSTNSRPLQENTGETYIAVDAKLIISNISEVTAYLEAELQHS